MSEAFAETRASIQRLRNLLRDADEDTRWMFGYWLLGLATMGAAIIGEFGWRGAGFCFGLVLWKVSSRTRD